MCCLACRACRPRAQPTLSPRSAHAQPILTTPLRDGAAVAIEVPLLLPRQTLLALPQGLAADPALHPVAVEEREERWRDGSRLREERRAKLLVVVLGHVSHAAPL